MVLRIPKAEIPTEFRERMIEQFGIVPEPLEVTWHNPRVAQASMELGGKVSEWDAADESLKSFAPHGRRGAGWLQLVPRPRLLSGAEPEPGPG